MLNNATGKWSLNNGAATWDFAENGTFKETYRANQYPPNTGTWKMVDDMIVVDYANKNIGRSVLSFDSATSLSGENRHANGNVHDLNLVKIE